MSAMNGYGDHPTVYHALSNEDFYSMFAGQNWSGLNEASRQQVLQEAVNRAAAQKGEIGACEVRFASLPTNILGQQYGSIIELNRSVFVEEKYSHEYNGNVIEERVANANYLALETALHEDVHAWQEQCANGTIKCANSALLEEYTANDGSISLVTKNGSTYGGSQYLVGKDPVLGYYLYYFQSRERDAHLFSQNQTIAIGRHIEEKYGKDPSFQEYMQFLMTEGYAAMHQQGSQLFNNPHFDKEINTVLKNEFYGTNNQVDPAIEKAVKEEMIASLIERINSQNAPQTPSKAVETAMPIMVETGLSNSVQNNEQSTAVLGITEDIMSSGQEQNEGVMGETANTVSDAGIEFDDNGIE